MENTKMDENGQKLENGLACLENMKMDENGHKLEKLYTMSPCSKKTYPFEGGHVPVTHIGHRHPTFVQAILMEDPSITSRPPEARTGGKFSWIADW